MLKPDGFDNVQAFGQSQQLPAGGYVCRVKNIANYTSETGKAMWKVMLDIAEGEFKDFFYNKYQRDKQYRADAKYPNNGIVYIRLTDDTGRPHRALKTFYMALKDSGTEIVWNENDEVTFRSIIGAQVGSLFRREEYVGNDNNVYMSTKQSLFVSTKDIREGNFTIPEDKLLENPYGSRNNNLINDIPDSFSAADDDIPF